MHDQHGNQISEVVPGSRVELRIHIKQLFPDIQQVSATIELSQPDGHNLVSLESGRFNGTERDQDSFDISCLIDDLPITPGVVQINFKLEGDGQVQDKITHAAYLIIAEDSAKNDSAENSFPTIKIQQKWELN